MWPDRVSNPGPLALESDILPTVLHSNSTSRYVLGKKHQDLSIYNLPLVEERRYKTVEMATTLSSKLVL